MAHQKLHSIDPKELPPEKPKLTRNAKEVEAESVAYTVAQHYGIETSDYSFAYIAGWSKGKETPELKASLDRIRNAADEMITSIDEQFMALQKEKESSLESTEKKKSVLKDLNEKTNEKAPAKKTRKRKEEAAIHNAGIEERQLFLSDHRP